MTSTVHHRLYRLFPLPPKKERTAAKLQPSSKTHFPTIPSTTSEYLQCGCWFLLKEGVSPKCFRGRGWNGSSPMYGAARLEQDELYFPKHDRLRWHLDRRVRWGGKSRLHHRNGNRDPLDVLGPRGPSRHCCYSCYSQR